MAKDDDNEQVKDTGTREVPADEVANAAAETLHGDRAREEQYPQSDATELPGGNTLVANEPQPDTHDRG